MNEEEKAIKFLENKTTNYSLSGEALHYYSILYYLIINLQKKNKQLKEQLKQKEEVIKKFEKYLNDCVSELENNYVTSSIQNAINTGIVDITKVILSKFNEILSKGEKK